MKKTGKVVTWISIFSTLCMGCYTPTVVTNYTPQLDDKELVFVLLWMRHDGNRYVYKDGVKAYVKSTHHHRIENGYEVTGKLVDPENKYGKDFSGVLYYDQIKEVTTSEYDATLTWSVIGGVVLLGAAIFGVLALALERNW